MKGNSARPMTRPRRALLLVVLVAGISGCSRTDSEALPETAIPQAPSATAAGGATEQRLPPKPTLKELMADANSAAILNAPLEAMVFRLPQGAAPPGYRDCKSRSLPAVEAALDALWAEAPPVAASWSTYDVDRFFTFRAPQGMALLPGRGIDSFIQTRSGGGYEIQVNYDQWGSGLDRPACAKAQVGGKRVSYSVHHDRPYASRLPSPSPPARSQDYRPLLAVEFERHQSNERFGRASVRFGSRVPTIGLSVVVSPDRTNEKRVVDWLRDAVTIVQSIEFKKGWR